MPLAMIRAAMLAGALLVAACSSGAPAERLPRVAVDADWARVPTDVPFGEVSAVDVDARGRVFVLHRAGRAWREPFPVAPIARDTVFVFDGRSGALLDSWGAGRFVMPHGLSLDEAGDVWITDVALQQVARFTPDGTEKLVLGREHGFDRPSDVAVGNGRVHVADGYRNRRIAVFDGNGRLVRQWGGEGTDPGRFNLPHAVAVDGGRVLVADRENGRVQVFASDGKLLAVWKGPALGHPYAVKPLPDGRVLVVEGRDRQDRYGAVLRVYRSDGSVERSLDAGRREPESSLGHDIAVAPDGTIYLVDHRRGQVVRFRLFD